MTASEMDTAVQTACAMRLAEAAIEGNSFAECEEHRLIAVADVVVLQGVANGKKTPPNTWRLRRADGREVSIFRLPEAAIR